MKMKDNGKKNVKKEPRVEIRKLNTFRAYYLQADNFDDLSETGLDELVADIKRRGLQQKIEILPDGTIISGHQRLRALKRLGWKSAEVIVRYDLEGADQNVVDYAFLAANYPYRHPDLLVKAKVAMRMYEALLGRRVRNHDWGEMNDARESVGRSIGMCGRNLQRYWAVLRTPKVVQDAFRSGKVTLVLAAKVGGLVDIYQKKIADRILKGEDPKAVVNKVIPPGRARPKNTGAAFRAGMKHLNGFLGEVESRVDKIRGSSFLDAIPTIHRARKVLRQIVEQLNNAAADDKASEQALKANAEEIAKLLNRHTTE